MATSADVAKRAGVSRATVSAVLNGKAAERRVPPATAERVLAAATELGYHTPHHARRLRTGTGTDAGFVACGSDPIRADALYLAAAYAAQAEGWFLSRAGAMADTGLVRIEEESLADLAGGVTELRMGRFDGLIVDAGADGPDRETITRIIERCEDRPLVCIDHPGSHSSVTIDRERGLLASLRHLATLGHRRVLLLDDGSLVPDPVPQQMEHLRRQTGLQLELTDRIDDPSAVAAMRDLLDGTGRGPTALILATLTSAIAVLAMLQLRGLQVPGDCSLVVQAGQEAILADPTLSTIDIPYHQAGLRAARMLCRPDDSGPSRHVLRSRFVSRASCAPPRGGRT